MIGFIGIVMAAPDGSRIAFLNGGRAYISHAEVRLAADEAGATLIEIRAIGDRPPTNSDAREWGAWRLSDCLAGDHH